MSLPTIGGRPVYRYYIAWTISGDLALELNFSGVSWSRKVRAGGTFSGQIYFENDTRLTEAFWGTMPGKMSLYVTKNGKAVWGGFIAKRAYDSATRMLSIEANSFEAYLYRRFIWHDVVQAGTLDQYQVVRNMIALMQTDFNGVATTADRASPRPDNANIGLTVDSRNSGRKQDTQTWLGFQLQNFGDALAGFSDNLYGFEYNIEVELNEATNKFTKRLVFRDTPPSQLPVGVAYTGTRPGINENFFEFPGNIISLGYDDSIDDATVRQWVVGAQPEPVETTTDVPAEDAVEKPSFRGVWQNEPYLSTQWPMLEIAESSEHSGVSKEATLDSYARSYGQQATPPRPAWTVTVNGHMNPEVGSYKPGDWCRLVVTDPFLLHAIGAGGEISRVLTKRISEFSVSVPDTEQVPETVTLTLIDEWNDGGT